MLNSITTTLRRQKQKELVFEAILGYIATACHTKSLIWHLVWSYTKIDVVLHVWLLKQPAEF